MIEASSNSNFEFSVQEARAIVRDHFEPNARTYWTDLAVTAIVAYAAYAAYMFSPWWSVSFFVGWLVGWLAFYRLASFMHELVHLRRGTFGLFRHAWNAICGIPFLMPSFMYYTHLHHHGRTTYGTNKDGEYLPLANRPVWHIILFLLLPLWVPALAVIRFAILAPMSWLIPSTRRWVHQRASSLVIDARYVRPLPTDAEVLSWRWQEAGCFAVVVIAVAALWLDIIQPRAIIRIYLMASCVMLLNQVRTLGAHRFGHEGRELTFIEQLLDSINYPNRPLLGELWAPVGLRFHALHHLFPSMPYHELAKAHAKLMAELPANSPYRKTVCSSLPAAIGELWATARQSTAKSDRDTHASNGHAGYQPSPGAMTASTSAGR